MAARGTPITTKTWRLDGVPFAWSASVVAPDRTCTLTLYLVRNAKAIRDMPHNTEPRNMLGPLILPQAHAVPRGAVAEHRLFVKWYHGDDTVDPMPFVRMARDQFDILHPFLVREWYVRVVAERRRGFRAATSPFTVSASYTIDAQGRLEDVGMVAAGRTDELRLIHQALYDTLRREQFEPWPNARPAPRRNEGVKLSKRESTGSQPWRAAIATYDLGDREQWKVEIRAYDDGEALVTVVHEKRTSAYVPYTMNTDTHRARYTVLLAELKDGQMVPRPSDGRHNYMDINALDISDAVVMQETFSAAHAHYVALGLPE